MIHNAVMKACDGLDGVVDGIIENPRECRFDYASLQCKGGDEAGCLTAAQVESAKKY
jgi:Tannase and feruloyl esterase